MILETTHEAPVCNFFMKSKMSLCQVRHSETRVPFIYNSCKWEKGNANNGKRVDTKALHLSVILCLRLERLTWHYNEQLTFLILSKEGFNRHLISINISKAFGKR